ncbi:TSUP family transporter [Knoellia koreensis]|uniref:Probable membrane transporter protein n=1 Tax=Knoellia koreensis TaxID=2730921 RepID=A0A849HBX2_9MICO|nr:sulfite exporter TauE/SafE family protein [Knoellia sp. DB2414S]
MSVTEALGIFLAGTAAGTINTVVGSGTLITFPTLLFFGFPPLTANMSNNIGLVGGGVTGSWGYRKELVGAGPAIRKLVPMSLLGGISGALLLRILPEGAFTAIVPVLIAIGVLLVVFGPALQRRAAAKHGEDDVHPAHRGGPTTFLLMAAVYLAGVYGGYFGAAQGVILMGVLSVLSSEPLQRLNGYKNVLALVVNAVAAIVFVIIGHDLIDWWVVALIAVGSLLGGVIGSTVGRRLPPLALRGLIVVIGVIGIVKIVWFS